MGHTHQKTDVQDADLLFKIDPITRVITNESGKTVVMQYDHNSERFTFEIPRYVEGHDMSLCDTVQIHYLNVGPTKADTTEGIYEVDDVKAVTGEEETVTFSWLISSNATQYAGGLSFVVHFACTADGEVTYAWDSEIYSGIFVRSTIHNADAVTLEYVDILEQWRERLFGVNEDGFNGIEQAVDDGVKRLEEVGDAIIKELDTKGDATLAQSWAVGGTGIRTGEDTDNSWYWARESAKEAIKAKEAADSVGNINVHDNHNITGNGVGSELTLQTFLDSVGTWFMTKVTTHLNFVEDLKKWLKNSGDTAEDQEGYALDARYGATLTNSVERIHALVPVNLTAAGWTGDAAPFTQTVSVPELKPTDDPMLTSLLSEDATLEQQKAYVKAYGMVATGSGTVGDGTVTFKVYKKPAVDIEVGLTRLRGEI